MSFYFNIKSTNEISFKDLFDNMNIPNLKFGWQPENLTEPIKGTKIFLLGKSTRGINISKDDDSYAVGINVMASEDDYNLALSATTAIAKLTTSEIMPEDSEGTISVEELKNKYNQEWIDSMKTHGASIFLEKVGKEGQLLSIGCCYMNYTIGPNIHKNLDDTNQLSYYNSLVKHIQQTQFFDQTKYQIPNVLVSSKQDGSNRKTYVVFYPHGAEFLSKADYVVFPYKEGKYELPYDQVPLIADSKFNKVDETQYTIEPLTETDYSELITRIENELSKIDEASIKSTYQAFTKDELDDEFNRLTSIPDARLKIFALQRMSNLISEFEERNIEMPNAKPKAESAVQKQATPPKHLKKYTKKIKPVEPKKPWWKFW